jgi:hypothetical protein
MLRVPRVFIAGVMKGGTTALYRFMTAHPSIRSALSARGTPVKEIHYFSFYQHLGLEWYLAHFNDIRSDQMYVDASPSYFDTCTSPALPRLIKATSPEARVILIFREPVERAVSHFIHLKTIVKEPSLVSIDQNDFFSRDFGRALLQLNELDYCLHQVLWLSMYYRKFIHYREVFGDRLLVIFNEQLRLQPYATMCHVFDFLQLEPIDDPIFVEEIYSKEHNSAILDPTLEVKLQSFLTSDFAALRRLAASTGHSRKIA